MKVKNILRPVFWGLILTLLISCATVGLHMPISPGDNVIGSIQTTFIAHESWLSKKETMNTHAYIKLLEMAVQKYSGNIDIRNIVWTALKNADLGDKEIFATGMVIKVNEDEQKK